MREQRFKFTLVDIVYSMVVVAGLVLYAKQGRIAKLKNILSHIRSLSLGARFLFYFYYIQLIPLPFLILSLCFLCVYFSTVSMYNI